MNMVQHVIHTDAGDGGQLLVQLTGEHDLHFNTIDSDGARSWWVMTKPKKTIELVGAIGERVSRETKMAMIRELARQVAEGDEA